MLRTLPKPTCLPHALYRTAQIRHFEHLAQTVYALPEPWLMERAGLAAWTLLRRLWPQARQVGVLCGAGNNGGDAYVLARWAQQAGYRVTLYATQPPRTSVAQAAAAAWAAVGGVTLAWSAAQGLPRVEVWVDGLLGIGLTRPTEGYLADLIHAVNATQRPILALDVPSGLNADTGAALGPTIRAQATLSFIGLKQGLCTGAAPDYTGSLHLHSLDLPARLYAADLLSARRLTWAKCAAALPQRARTAHKGQAGRVLVIGGQPGMSGAVLLAGRAALRSGAGLVAVATHPQHAAILTAAQPELMGHGVATAAELAPLLAWAEVIALGCGLGQSAWGLALWQAALNAGKPLVLDADGLNLLAEQPQQAEHWILTPHPGEAARLLGWTTAQVQADRYAALVALQQRYGGVVVLKGAGTLIGSERQAPGVCSGGNPGMASGGMGDTLTGAIAGLWAQGATAAEAAELGVCLHAVAADRVAARCGERGLLASDVSAVFTEVFHALEP